MMKNLTKYFLGIILLLNGLSSCKQNYPSVKQEKLAEKISIKALVKNDSIDIAINELMEQHHIPGLSIAFLKNGKLNTTRTYGLIQKGKDEKINTETMFSVGSISKVVNAIATLKLVNDGKLNLDEDINQYLTKWKVKETKFTKDNPVTLRKILSHTAGFTVHGFADFLPEEPMPTTLQILNGEKPAKNEKVFVNSRVGSQFKYSGGGISVIQMIIEELTGLTYHEAVAQILFEQLDLKRTTFENPVPASFANIAKAHNNKGKPVALPRGYQMMPEKAASGLWTCPSDLAKLLELITSSKNKGTSNLLSQELVADMISPEPNSQFGLGPKIEINDKETIVYHNGANDSYRAHFKIFWNNQSGYIIMTNGTNGLDLIKDLKPLLDKDILGD